LGILLNYSCARLVRLQAEVQVTRMLFFPSGCFPETIIILRKSCTHMRTTHNSCGLLQNILSLVLNSQNIIVSTVCVIVTKMTPNGLVSIQHLKAFSVFM